MIKCNYQDEVGHTGLNSTLNIMYKHATGSLVESIVEYRTQYVFIHCPSIQQEKQTLTCNQRTLDIREVLHAE